MGFAGELTTIGLPEVFENLAANRMSGVLTVTGGSSRVAVLFEEGAVRGFRSSLGPSIDYLEVLRRSQALTPELFRAAERRRRRRRTVLDVIADQTDFDRDAYCTTLAQTIREEILQIFAWPKASFVFEEGARASGEFDADQLACDVTLDPDEIVAEAARRADGWDAIASFIDSDKDVFLPAEKAAQCEEHREILDLMDGCRNLSALVRALPMGRFELLRRIAEMNASGLVVRADIGRLRALAAAAEEQGEVTRAIGHLEAAIAMGYEDSGIAVDLSRLYQRSGRPQEAACQLARRGREQERKGDLDGALESYERAVVLAPYDTGTLARIVEIHANRGAKVEQFNASLRLAEALAANGHLEESLETYHRLLERDEQNVRLRKAIAATYIKLHEPERAAHELTLLADRAWQAEDYERALHYYRSVLAVKRDSPEAAERVEALERSRLWARRKVRRRRILVAVSALLLGLLVWQASREWSARKALHEAAHSALLEVGSRGADASLIDAIARYSRICVDYSFTRGAREAEQAAQSLLMDEIHRIRYTLPGNPGEAEALLRRMGRVKLPSALQPLWRSARDHLLQELAAGTPK